MSDPGNTCRVLTQKGNRCTRKVLTDGLCWQHARQERIVHAAKHLQSEAEAEAKKPKRATFVASAALLLAVVTSLVLYDAEQILAMWVARIIMPPITIISIAALIDSVTQKPLKKIIAGFFIGMSEVSFKEYEMAVISSIINLFSDRNGKISFSRVLAYSWAGSLFIISAIVAIKEYPNLFGTSLNKEAPSALVLFSIVLLSIVTANLSVASDYFSLCVTKALFLKRRWHPLLLPLIMTLDAVLSVAIALLPLTVTLGLAYSIAGRMFTDDQTAAVLSPILLATGTTLSLSIFITILQALILMSGVLFRFIGGTLLTHVKLLAIEDYPLTVLMIWAFAVAIPGRILFLWWKVGLP